MKRALIFILAALLLTSCGQTEEHSATVFAMDTVMELTAYGENGEAALEAAKTEIYRLDGLFDRRNEDGEIFALNKNGGGEVSDDTAGLLRRGEEIRALTGGAFDMTVAPVMDLWGFYGQDYRVPDGAELAAALEKVGGEVTVEGNTVTLGEGTLLDPGGIAKGWASARLMEIFREKGVTSGLVSLGGSVQALGSRPDGTPWRVAIQDPDGEGYAAVLSLTDTAAVTSGDYQRYFEQDGKIYHHIIDPSTGRPADSGLRSVTVVCRDGALADGLSTALFVMGRERALDLWRESGGFEAVFIDSDGGIAATAGLRGLIRSDKEIVFCE